MELEEAQKLSPQFVSEITPFARARMLGEQGIFYLLVLFGRCLGRFVRHSRCLADNVVAI